MLRSSPGRDYHIAVENPGTCCTRATFSLSPLALETESWAILGARISRRGFGG